MKYEGEQVKHLFSICGLSPVPSALQVSRAKAHLEILQGGENVLAFQPTNSLKTEDRKRSEKGLGSFPGTFYRQRFST